MMSDGSWKYLQILRAIVTNQPQGGGSGAQIAGLIAKILKWVVLLVIVTIAIIGIAIVIFNFYERSDNRSDRGAVAVTNGAYGESYEQPVYLKQGWKPSDSLWFYNTTQGSGLLPWDFFLVLEQADSTELFRSAANIDRFRYLPQRTSGFNKEALPVGFAREPYKGKDYVGYTCAACHTAQVNFGEQALRIDGGPAMADMVGFLEELYAAMQATLSESDKEARFVENVINLDNDYHNADDILEGLRTWTQSIQLYNRINKTEVNYGHARLDAFGRIFNRVLKHVINNDQMADKLSSVTNENDERILTDTEITNVLAGLEKVILGDTGFLKVLGRLQSTDPGLPGLTPDEVTLVLEALFNEPNAPVSYPFLWDITHSDYVQWNGLANNAGPGPIGRNAGEVIGVFGILDWSETGQGWWTVLDALSAYITGQERKKRRINFESSIDLNNLRRLESRLKSLRSPLWEDASNALAKLDVDVADWKIDPDKADKGRMLYEVYCESCHEIIDRTNWDRLMVARMSGIDKVGTDPQMALNSVTYSGQSGNFEDTIQPAGVGTTIGPMVIQETAPVAQILTSATKGVVATPNVDNGVIRGFFEWAYVLVTSVTNNKIKYSVKAGDYQPDTTSAPFASLKSYKARSLNGIWATAPYLHNGSVPTLHDLFKPAKRAGDPASPEFRPVTFMVGKREFDPKKVGFVSEGYEGFKFDTTILGNHNTGHEYAAGRSPQLDGNILPALGLAERDQLLEFLKTL